jgi:hypothetical protein
MTCKLRRCGPFALAQLCCCSCSTRVCGQQHTSGTLSSSFNSIFTHTARQMRALGTLYKEMHTAVKQEVATAKAVFPNPDMVRG